MSHEKYKLKKIKKSLKKVLTYKRTDGIIYER